MNNNLLIIGAGQYGVVAKEIAQSMSVFDKIDFLDDTQGFAIGKICDCEKFCDKYAYAVVAIGNNELRLTLIDKISPFFKIATLISPFSYVSPSAKIESGTIVEPLAVVQTNAQIGKGCLICSGAIVKHDSVVGKGCYLDCNCVVQPRIVVNDLSKIEPCMICD